MILRLGEYVKLNKEGFINEYKPFRLGETDKIDFNKEYKISELYDGNEVDVLDTNEVSDFIFWVENIKMELATEWFYNELKNKGKLK
jgi:hypothetical protein